MKFKELPNGIIVVEDNKCWFCGKEFEDDKTAHHSIEKKFHPKRNIIIPICNFCHNSMHKTTTQINSVKSKIIGLNNYINELNEMIKEIK